MKKIITSLFFCIVLHTYAQENISIQQTEEMPNWPFMLSNIGTSQVTSGVLIDKVTSFSNLVTFNRPENNLSGYDHFYQAMSELYRASEQTRFISPQELKNRIAGTIAENTVDVGIINTSFQKLNYNENTPNDGGLLFQNGKFTSISGKPAYLSRNVIITSPLKNVVKGTSAIYKFSNNLIFNNAKLSIKKLSVDFGDGISNTIISNGVISTASKTVNYSSKGIKFLKFMFTYFDNTTLTTYAEIYFDKTESGITAKENLPCYEILKDKGTHYNTTLPFKGYNETSAVYGQIDYTIFYNKNNNAKKILKPIIIIDGFDPKDKRKVLDCECENDADCFLANSDLKNNGLFANPVYTRTFNAEKHVSIEDMMFYKVKNPVTQNDDNPNLITKLRENGYDVIIINNPTYTTINQAGQTVKIDGGADYIERNGLNLVSFIQSIKTTLTTNGSSEKLVIVGPSMGGQISRYALAYMDKKFAETNNPIWQHNTRLWISVDSPHLGANIALAAQANVWFLGEKLYNAQAKDQYDNMLNSVAAKQQIISQFSKGLATGNTTGASFFNTYYNNLNSNGLTGSGGYPVTTSTFRKIALVNGSLTGNKVGNENDMFLSMRGYIDLSWWFFNWKVTLLRLDDRYMPSTGQSSNIFVGDGQNFNIGLNHWYINHPYYTLNVTNNNIKGSLDVVPGGLFSSQRFIKEGVENGLSEKDARSEVRNYLDWHSFIPTFSALGHLQPNQNWGNPLNTNLTCSTNKLTPFDSYYGDSENTQHTSFTEKSVNWLMKELGDNNNPPSPQAPSFPIDATQFVGANIICLNSTSTYSFIDICKIPGNATWSLSNSNAQIISSTGIAATLKGLVSGSVILTADFGNGQTLTKTIWIGNPLFSYETHLMEGTTNTYIFTAHPSPNPNINQGETYTWEVLSVQGGTSAPVGYISTGSELFLTGYPPFEYEIRLKSQNACGFITEDFIYGLLSGEEAGKSLQSYIVTPNPATEVINIKAKKTKISENATALLYDIFGKLQSKTIISNGLGVINIQRLLPGSYYLKINYQGETESYTIIKK